MIITLAGHVDHGKTSLVQALTGIDTDRLAEEKARGLTIDLGFAYIDGGRIGFVDVPGHHKFIHNMVAGIASNQIALLVIAADDGPMPQSREHLQILSLAGIRQGVVAMTKTDRVDPERLSVCEEEIKQLVAGSFLTDAPIIATSIEDPSSIQALLKTLRDAETAEPTNQTGFRLAVDRAFNIKGAGLVVTGTIHAGSVDIEDTLYHFPSKQPIRVRGLRAQDREVQTARQGDRCAINLGGIDLAEVARGDWLTAAARQPAHEITVRLNVLADFPRAIKHWTPVHVYHATSHATGRIALHNNTRIKPGVEALADLVLDEPLAVEQSDRLVIRDHSLDTTLGGGKVVFAQEAVTYRRRNMQRLSTLQAYDAENAETACKNLLALGAFDTQSFANNWQLDNPTLDTLLQANQAVRIGAHAITQTQLGAMAKQVITQLTEHQKANPSSPGVRENTFSGMTADFRRQVLGALVQAERISVNGGIYSLPTHKAELPDTLAKLWQRLETALDVNQPPSSGDLAKQWQLNQAALEKDLKELTRRGYLTFVGDHRYFLPKRLEALAAMVRGMADNKPFTVKEFRDQSGIGRNVAINILEYFDGRGFTRRQGNERVLLRQTLKA